MKIKLSDKYYLNSDKFCYWITEEVEVKTGKNKGSITEKRISGYMNTFAGVVDTFVEKKLKAAETGDMEELSQIITELKETVLSWKCAIEKGE